MAVEAEGSRRSHLLRTALAEPEILVGQIILAAFVGLTTLQVTLRYAFNAPLTWPEELNAILLVWLTFIGAVGLARRNEHIRVELVEEWFGERASLALDVVFHLVTIVFLVVLVWGGWQVFQELEFERTPALRWKLSYVYAIVPISAALMAVAYARLAWQALRRLGSGGAGGA
jgi:TRAP-type C4-dicarboxylate transport system permease small subunit